MNLIVQRYIKKYFQLNFPEYYVMYLMDKNRLEYIYGVIEESLIDKDKLNEIIEVSEQVKYKNKIYNEIKIGYKDQEIFNLIDKFLNEFYTEKQRKEIALLYEFVCNVVEDSNCSKDIMDHIVKKVVGELYPQFTEDKVNDPEFVKKIEKKYAEIFKQIIGDLSNKVKPFVVTNVDIFQMSGTWGWVTEKELVMGVVKSILLNHDRSFLEQISKNRSNVKSIFDEYVDKYIKVYFSNNRAAWKKADVRIEKIIEKNYPNKSVDDMRAVFKVVKECLGKMNPSPIVFDIASGRFDRQIRKFANDYFVERGEENTMVFYPENTTAARREISSGVTERGSGISDNFQDQRTRSVKRDGSPRRIKLIRKKKQMVKTGVTILLIASLAGFIVNGLFKMVDIVSDNNALKNVSMIDDYYYSNIHTIHTDAFEVTADNVIETFDEYSQFDNDNYSFLGFYRAYKSVKEHRLYIMDNMLAEIKRDIRYDDNYSYLYSLLSNKSCYLSFMYDRLYDMGFTEIEEQKYVDLLNKYLSIRSEHPSEDAVKYLSSGEQKLLERVRDKYIKLSDEYLVELGKLLEIKDYTINAYDNRRHLI